jgi:hypothetical protein
MDWTLPLPGGFSARPLAVTDVATSARQRLPRFGGGRAYNGTRPPSSVLFRRRPRAHTGFSLTGGRKHGQAPRISEQDMRTTAGPAGE